MGQDSSVTGTILVTIALNEVKEKFMGGGVPIFIVENKEEQERLALLLSRILKGMVHDLENGIYIIIRH
jgi:hypothetical protein